jgi:hypothetical protein
MTEERLALSELLERAGDGDFLRTVAEAGLQFLMEADVEGLIGAGRSNAVASARYRSPDGAVMLEQNDEWQLQHRYMQVRRWQSLSRRQTTPRPGKSQVQPDNA